MSMTSEAIRRTFYILPKIPRTVQIEVTNRCNLNCKMCQRKYFNLRYEDISFEFFKKIVDKLKGVEEIILTGWGEPLIHPKLFDMIKYCKRKKFKTRLTTNGLLLTSKMRKKLIKSNLDSITFSIDSIDKNVLAHFNKSSLKNLEELIKLRKGKKPRIIIQSTLHKNKEEDIYDIIKYASKVGVDSINLARLDLRFNRKLKRPTIIEEKKLLKNIEKISKELKIQVNYSPFAMFTGFNRNMYKLFRKSFHRFGKFCPKTYDYCYINLDGLVTPCCSLPNYIIGNIKEDNLENIWKSKKFVEFRKNQKIVCFGCDILRMI